MSFYNASKETMEGLYDSFSQEVAALGIKVTLVKPGSFATGWGGNSLSYSVPLPA